MICYFCGVEREYCLKFIKDHSKIDIFVPLCFLFVLNIRSRRLIDVYEQCWEYFRYILKLLGIKL